MEWASAAKDLVANAADKVKEWASPSPATAQPEGPDFWAPSTDYRKSPEYLQATEGAIDPAAAGREYLRSRFEKDVPLSLGGVDDARRNYTRTFRAMAIPELEDLARARLAAYPSQTTALWQKEGYTPQQQREFMESAAKSGMTDPAFKLMRGNISDQIEKEIDAQAHNFESTMDAVSTSKMNAPDFGQFLFSSWSNLVTPVALLVGLFGKGKLPKLLGLMGAAFGGYDLYNRYKVIADPSNPANSFFTRALQDATVQDGQPSENPFGNMEEVQTQTYQRALQQLGDEKQAQAITSQAMQGVKDFQFLAQVGFGNALLGRGRQAATDARNVYGYLKPQAVQ